VKIASENKDFLSQKWTEPAWSAGSSSQVRWNDGQILHYCSEKSLISMMIRDIMIDHDYVVIWHTLFGTWGCSLSMQSVQRNAIAAVDLSTMEWNDEARGIGNACPDFWITLLGEENSWIFDSSPLGSKRPTNYIPWLCFSLLRVKEDWDGWDTPSDCRLLCSQNDRSSIEWLSAAAFEGTAHAAFDSRKASFRPRFSIRFHLSVLYPHYLWKQYWARPETPASDASFWPEQRTYVSQKLLRHWNPSGFSHPPRTDVVASVRLTVFSRIISWECVQGCHRCSRLTPWISSGIGLFDTRHPKDSYLLNVC
jgi:hypothetical protein